MRSSWKKSRAPSSALLCSSPLRSLLLAHLLCSPLISLLCFPRNMRDLSMRRHTLSALLYCTVLYDTLLDHTLLGEEDGEWRYDKPVEHGSIRTRFTRSHWNPIRERGRRGRWEGRSVPVRRRRRRRRRRYHRSRGSMRVVRRHALPQNHQFPINN